MDITNKTNVTTQQSFLWTPHDVIKGTTFSVMTIVVVVTNITCLLALKHTRIKPATRVLMYSLNTADLCSGIFVLFPRAISSFVNAWVLGYGGCFINVLVGGMPFYTSNWTLLAMAVERYIAVVKPLKFRAMFTLRRARLIVIFIWIASFSYEILVMGLNQFQVHFFPPSNQCWSLGTAGSDVYIKLFVMFMIYGPFIAFAVIYIIIFCFIRRQSIRRKEMTNRLSTIAKAPRNHGGPSEQEVRAAKTFMIITVAFFVTTSAPTIGYVIEIITGEETSELMFILTDVMSYTNAWLNTLIYFFRNPSFRSSVKGLFKQNNLSHKETTMASDSVDNQENKSVTVSSMI